MATVLHLLTHITHWAQTQWPENDPVSTSYTVVWEKFDVKKNCCWCGTTKIERTKYFQQWIKSNGFYSLETPKDENILPRKYPTANFFQTMVV